MKNEKDVSYTIYEFSIAMQIWAYEAVTELSKCFGQRVGERSQQLLDIQLHVHATLHPTEAEHDLPYITNLVSFPDRPVRGHRLVEDMTVALWVTAMTISPMQGSRTTKHSQAMTVRHRKAATMTGLRLMRVEIAVTTLPARPVLVRLVDRLSRGKTTIVQRRVKCRGERRDCHHAP
ncbi:Hypothetical predicted protein [Olea europaea subsp. europaea]|uniref:Uncharacterized protein n=1 Tax=Olea europaea subsp. europaea TaxID=158383 RepID=A0A8S0TAD5_OLEEU|nr:Hypothetical predicted protein [Olea europaea subsp. europaea]